MAEPNTNAAQLTQLLESLSLGGGAPVRAPVERPDGWPEDLHEPVIIETGDPPAIAMFADENDVKHILFHDPDGEGFIAMTTVEAAQMFDYQLAKPHGDLRDQYQSEVRQGLRERDSDLEVEMARYTDAIEAYSTDMNRHMREVFDSSGNLVSYTNIRPTTVISQATIESVGLIRVQDFDEPRPVARDPGPNPRDAVFEPPVAPAAPVAEVQTPVREEAPAEIAEQPADVGDGPQPLTPEELLAEIGPVSDYPMGETEYGMRYQADRILADINRIDHTSLAGQQNLRNILENEQHVDPSWRAVVVDFIHDKINGEQADMPGYIKAMDALQQGDFEAATAILESEGDGYKDIEITRADQPEAVADVAPVVDNSQLITPQYHDPEPGPEVIEPAAGESDDAYDVSAFETGNPYRSMEDTMRDATINGHQAGLQSVLEFSNRDVEERMAALGGVSEEEARASLLFEEHFGYIYALDSAVQAFESVGINMVGAVEVIKETGEINIDLDQLPQEASALRDELEQIQQRLEETTPVYEASMQP